jgi:hypothetical protein
MRITRTFDEIADHSYGFKACERCGKNITKTFKASQTISPWNQKSQQQIHEENSRSLAEKLRDWEACPELCSKCRKADLPDVPLDMVTKEDWEATSKLRSKLAELEAEAAVLKREIENTFIGRHLEIGCGPKKKIGQIERLYCEYGFVFNCAIMRVDLKGLTESYKQISAGEAFK